MLAVLSFWRIPLFKMLFAKFGINYGELCSLVLQIWAHLPWKGFFFHHFLLNFSLAMLRSILLFGKLLFSRKMFAKSCTEFSLKNRGNIKKNICWGRISPLPSLSSRFFSFILCLAIFLAYAFLQL